jgi:hypothetical protein
MILLLGRGEHCPRERQHQRSRSSCMSGALSASQAWSRSFQTTSTRPTS